MKYYLSIHMDDDFSHGELCALLYYAASATISSILVTGDIHHPSFLISLHVINSWFPQLAINVMVDKQPSSELMGRVVEDGLDVEWWMEYEVS